MSEDKKPDTQKPDIKKPDIAVVPRLDEEEKAALNALLKYNPDAKDPHVFNTIPRFLGGTLYLIEFGEERDNRREEWCVLVKNGRATVYYDYEYVLQSVAESRTLIDELFSSNVILAVISALILAGAFIAFYLKGSVDEPFRGAITAVLGFWFGKTAPKSA
jgi:hypothetical protein